jgi:hypothetical protein
MSVAPLTSPARPFSASRPSRTQPCSCAIHSWMAARQIKIGKGRILSEARVSLEWFDFQSEFTQKNAGVQPFDQPAVQTSRFVFEALVVSR